MNAQIVQFPPTTHKHNFLGQHSRYDKFTRDEALAAISFETVKTPTFYPDLQGKTRQSANYSIIRKDNGFELGCVSEEYEMITHAEVLEPALAALQDLDFVFKIVALKNQGSRILIDAASPNQALTINGENHIPRVVITNSYDKSTSVNVQFGFFRMVCTNGIIAPEMSGSVMKLHQRHSQKARKAILNWSQVLNDLNWVQTFRSQLESLDTPLSKEETMVILGSVFNVVEEKLKDSKVIHEAIRNAYFGDGQNGDLDKPLTKWEVFNGITQTLRDKMDNATPIQAYSRISNANDKTVKALTLLLAA